MIGKMSLAVPDIEVRFERNEPVRNGRLLPGAETIGRGYDVFGEYVNAEFTKQHLFDLGELEEDLVSSRNGYRYLKPERVDVLTHSRGHFERREGSTSRAYQDDLRAKAGLEGEYGYFRGEIEVEFERSHRRCSSFHFIKTIDRAYKYLLRLESDPREFLLERVRKDLHEREPKDLFDRYGTHYLHSLIIGGCAVTSSATNTENSSWSTELSQAAELAFKTHVGRISGREETEYGKGIEEFFRNSKVEVKTMGGRSEFARSIATGNYERWADSVEENMDWVALPRPSADLGPLKPIWELCDDEQRRDELRTAFEKYAEEEHTPEPDPVIVPVYGYSTGEDRHRWRYSLRPRLPGRGWRPHDRPFFYVSTEPDDDGKRVPVYAHSAMNPIRFKLSLEERETGPEGPWSADADPDGWTGETNPVWYAYPPAVGGGEDRVAVFGHTDPNSVGKSGWFYNVEWEEGADGKKTNGNRGWNRHGVVFFADVVKIHP